jgi:hypothetical protein
LISKQIETLIDTNINSRRHPHPSRLHRIQERALRIPSGNGELRRLLPPLATRGTRNDAGASEDALLSLPIYLGVEASPGLRSIVKSEMDVSLYTQCSIADFLHLDDDPNCWRESPLTYPPVACVVLSCLKGAKWDLTNESILIREVGSYE